MISRQLNTFSWVWIPGTFTEIETQSLANFFFKCSEYLCQSCNPLCIVLVLYMVNLWLSPLYLPCRYASHAGCTSTSCWSSCCGCSFVRYMFLKTWSIAIVISENDSIVFFKQTVYLWQMVVMFMTRWGIYNTAFGDYPKQILTYIMSILIYLIL